MPDLTRTQFIFQMIMEYGRRYPGITARPAMAMAARTYRDFVEGEGVEFGDAQYDWTADGAHTLVKEMDAYA